MPSLRVTPRHSATEGVESNASKGLKPPSRTRERSLATVTTSEIRTRSAFITSPANELLRYTRSQLAVSQS